MTILPQLRVVTTRASPVILDALILRGGDISRTKTQLEAYSSYAVVAALLFNTALRMWTSQPNFKELNVYKRRWITKYLEVVYLICSTLSVMGGLHATVVFALVGVYSKVALGKSLDLEAATFLASTHMYRQQAFRSFVVSLVSSIIQFEIALCTRINIVMGEQTVEAVLRAVQAVAVLVGVAMCVSWLKIMGAAQSIYRLPK